jgi:arsenate reductase
MSIGHIAGVIVGISSILLLPQASGLARQTPGQGTEGHTIVFVCEHGSAKSVIAAAHFNDFVIKKGLPYRAVARGVHPDKEIPLYVKSGLAAEGLNIRDPQPKRFGEEDALRAERVITLGCTLRMPKSVIGHKLQEWNDVPSPSESYQNASRAIAERVAVLLKELTDDQTSQ